MVAVDCTERLFHVVCLIVLELDDLASIHKLLSRVTGLGYSQHIGKDSRALNQHAAMDFEELLFCLENQVAVVVLDFVASYRLIKGEQLFMSATRVARQWTQCLHGAWDTLLSMKLAQIDGEKERGVRWLCRSCHSIPFLGCAS
jgi:hypothetical protein